MVKIINDVRIKKRKKSIFQNENWNPKKEIRFGLGQNRQKPESYELVYTSTTFFSDVHIGQNSQNLIF